MGIRFVTKVLACFFIGAFALAAGGNYAVSADFPKVMNVGLVTEMTGNWSWAGKWKSQAAAMAIDELNASGEFPFKFELIVVDHASGDAKKASVGMRKLVDVYHIPFVVTGFNTVTLAVREIAEEKGIPVINPGGMAGMLLNKKYLYNTRPMSPQLSISMANYSIEKYGVKRPAMTYWAEIAGEEMADAHYYLASKMGVEIVAEIAHQPLITDFRSDLARVKAAKPDALWIWSYGNDTGYIVKQAKEMGMNIPMFGIAGINPVMIEVAGEDKLKGLYSATQYFDPKSKLPFIANFAKNYHDRYKEWPEELAANYYEPIYMLRDCIRYVLAKGGDPFDGHQLDNAIRTIKVFPCLYGNGTMEITPDGSVIKPVAIVQYQGGTAKDVVFIKEVTPPPNRSYPKRSK